MDRRTSLLEAAIRLFVDQGFDNTPTSQISKEADVATGTLFNYFKSKEDLINNAFLHSSQKSIEYINPSEETDFKQYLRNFWMESMKWALENTYYVKFMMKFSNSVYITNLTRENVEKILKPYYQYMANVLTSERIKLLPQPILINTYNNIFSVFFNYLADLEEYNGDIIDQGFNTVWGALEK